MQLIHTLLFLLRETMLSDDLRMAENCLRSLEKSRYKTVIVYNQGGKSNVELEAFLKAFNLRCVVIGGGENVGTVVGRQSLFEYVYEHFPDAAYVSELHMDMIFSSNWEDALVDFLQNNDEPMVSCGIVSDANVLSLSQSELDVCLGQFAEDKVHRGFNLPCVHKIEVLKAVGGYDARFLKGKHAFEDDSLLLGYYYYYGTRANWTPKVTCGSVVYHAVGGQRFTLNDNLYTNFDGLLKQYGVKGVGALATIHTSPWQVQFFSGQFDAMTGHA